MDDSKIIDLYFKRSEDAIKETDIKYGKYCRKIAYNILYSNEDSEECVNDTYMKAWESIPLQIPRVFSAFLGRITRNLALNRYAFQRAEKRNNIATVPLDELEGVVLADDFDPTMEIALRDAVNSFVKALPRETRVIFVRRYWYMSSIKDIAEDYKIPQGTVKSILSRTKKRFALYLKREGIEI